MSRVFDICILTVAIFLWEKALMCAWHTSQWHMDTEEYSEPAILILKYAIMLMVSWFVH